MLAGGGALFGAGFAGAVCLAAALAACARAGWWCWRREAAKAVVQGHRPVLQRRVSAVGKGVGVRNPLHSGRAGKGAPEALRKMHSKH